MGHADRPAVVLGASMAGLLSARVLAEYYPRVTIVDRDEIRQLLDDLFPGLPTEVLAAGVPSGDLLGGIRWLLSDHRLRRVDIGQPLLFASRPTLEHRVRARVRALPGVQLAGGQDIVALTTTADRRTSPASRYAVPTAEPS